MKRLLILAPLTVLALAAAAEAQSQTGGLPDVSERVTVLETQNKALETRVTTLQAEAKALETRVTTLQSEAKALETRVNTLQSDNATLQGALSKEIETRKSGDETLQTALSKETETRKSGDETLQGALSKEVETRKAADETFQTALSKETADRTTADTDLGQQITTQGVSSAQFEGVGAGNQLTNEFVLILKEIVGPGSWVAIATISNLRGDTLNGSPAFRTCELRNQAEAFIGGTSGIHPKRSTRLAGGALLRAELTRTCAGKVDLRESRCFARADGGRRRRSLASRGRSRCPRSPMSCRTC